MTTSKVWDSQKNTAAEALELPEGRYVANFGILIEQSVTSDHTLEAAQAIIDAGLPLSAATQAKIIVTAQNKSLAFEAWAPTQLF